MQAQSQMAQLGDKPLLRCHHPASNLTPTLMSFVMFLFSNKTIEPFMIDYLNGPSLVLLVFFTTVSEEKCHVMMANNGYTALLPDGDKMDIFE